MNRLLLVSFLLCASITFSQNDTTLNIHQRAMDSVVKISEKMESAQEKIDVLCTYVSATRYPKYTKPLLQLSEKIARNSGEEKLQATSYYYTSNYFYFNAQLDSALVYINKARPLIDDTSQPLLRSFLMGTESGIYKKQGNNPLHISTLLTSQKLLDKVDTLQLNAVEKGRYKNSILSSINSLANYYNTIEEYDKAKEYYDQGYTTSIQSNLAIPAGVFITNKGDLYLNMKEYNNALSSFEEGKKLKSKGNAPQRMLINSDLNIAIAHTGLGNYELAEDILNNVVAFYSRQDNKIKLGQAYSYRGDLYLKKGAYERAIKDCSLGKELSQVSKAYDQYSQACNCLYTAYKALGQNKNALLNYEQFIKTKDSIFSEKNIKKQTEQELQYEFNKTQELKNAELIAKENESKLYSVLAVTAGTFACFLGFFFYKNRKKNILLDKQKTLLEVTVDEKNILLRETHHRVKNSFQMVSSLLFIQSETAQDKEAKLAIREAQNRVRSMVLIHQKLYSKDQLVGIDAQEYMQDFTKDIIESYQFENEKINYTVTAQPMVLAIETITPIGLMLNELITNVLKHAFPIVIKESILEVSFYKKNEELVLEVSDNGVGMPVTTREGSFGIELIEALSKKLKGKLSFTNNVPQGTIATVHMNRFEIV